MNPEVNNTYLPPLVKHNAQIGIVPKDSMIQMQGIAPNSRLDIPSQTETIKNSEFDMF